MDINTAYKTLGLLSGATKEDVVAAYRKLAKQWHPDVNKSPEAEETFKKINQAYEFLITAPKPQPFSGEDLWDQFFGGNFDVFTGGGPARNKAATSQSILTLELGEDVSPQLINEIIQILVKNGIKIKGYRASVWM